MADTILKETAKKVSTPKVNEDTMANLRTAPTQEEKEAMKRELMAEVVSEMGAVEVVVMKTSIENSDSMAKMLNESPKKISMWELEEGEKRGAIEEVTINGAVAQIPKGVSVLVPVQIAEKIEIYKQAEKTAGEKLRNQSGGYGIRADRDNVTKDALGL